MTDTRLINLDHEPLSYSLLAFPPRRTEAQMLNVVNELQSELGDTILPTEAGKLHSTVFVIMHHRDYGIDKDAFYASKKAQFEDHIDRVISGHKKFSVIFDTIEASPDAIIIKARDSSKFNEIRTELLPVLQFSIESKLPPDITHITIARYAKVVPLEEVQEIVSRMSVHIEMEVGAFRIVRTKTHPLREYEIVREFPLVS